MKICSKCRVSKEFGEFNIDKSRKDGFYPQCRICFKETKEFLKSPEGRQAMADRMAARVPTLEGNKVCGRCKAEQPKTEFSKSKKSKDGLWWICKTCEQKRGSLYYQDNKEAIDSKHADYYWENREARLDYRAAYYLEHKEESRASNDAWLDAHPGFAVDYVRARKLVDVGFRLSSVLRTRIGHIVSGDSKAGSAVQDLGCSPEELRSYLEKSFYPNPETGEIMSWDNYGQYGWHIDHKIPLASFDLTDREQFLRACHFSNLQPLWAKDNLSKGARLDWQRAA